MFNPQLECKVWTCKKPLVTPKFSMEQTLTLLKFRINFVYSWQHLQIWEIMKKISAKLHTILNKWNKLMRLKSTFLMLIAIIFMNSIQLCTGNLKTIQLISFLYSILSSLDSIRKLIYFLTKITFKETWEIQKWCKKIHKMNQLSRSGHII